MLCAQRLHSPYTSPVGGGEPGQRVSRKHRQEFRGNARMDGERGMLVLEKGHGPSGVGIITTLWFPKPSSQASEEEGLAVFGEQ